MYSIQIYIQLYILEDMELMESVRFQTHKSLSNMKPGSKYSQKKTLLQTKQILYKRQEENYLRKELQDIINHEIKTAKLKSQLEKDLVDYNNLNEGVVTSTISEKEKLKRFRAAQDQKIQKKIIQFVENKEKKENRLQRIKEQKIKQMKTRQQQRKVKEIEMKAKKLRREQEIFNKTVFYMGDMQIKQKKQNSYQIGDKLKRKSRSARSCQSGLSETYTTKQNLDEQLQKKRIKDYISKLKRCEEKMVVIDLQKAKRKEKSYNSPVKCLVGQRISKQIEKMEKTQQEYKSRMENFEETHLNLEKSRQMRLIKRSISRQNMRTKVLEKKEKLHEKYQSKIKQNFENKLVKTEKCQANIFKREVDEKNSKILFDKNLDRLKIMEKTEKHEINMRWIYKKIKDIRQNNEHEKLSEKEQKILLSFLNTESKNYRLLKQFIENSKGSFIRRQQEEEQALKKKKQRKNS